MYKYRPVCLGSQLPLITNELKFNKLHLPSTAQRDKLNKKYQQSQRMIELLRSECDSPFFSSLIKDELIKRRFIKYFRICLFLPIFNKSSIKIYFFIQILNSGKFTAHLML